MDSRAMLTGPSVRGFTGRLAVAVAAAGAACACPVTAQARASDAWVGVYPPVSAGSGSLASDAEVPAPEQPVPAAAVAAPAGQDAVPATPTTPVPHAWLDRMQGGVFRGVNATGHWIDGWFADDEQPRRGADAMGRLGVGTYWDQRDGVDPSFRLRARVPFENARNRVGLLLGRGPEREIIENRQRAGSTSLPPGFQDVQDDSWLLGLGYSPRAQLGRGLELDAGVRVRFDPEVFGRAIYRWNVELSDSTLFRPTQTVFWRRSRGFGETTDLTLDHLVGERFLVRAAASATVAEDTEGLEWQSFLTLFQNLAGRDSMAYSVVVAGETNAPVELQNFGVQFRYRRQVLRDWLFVELLQSVTWPRFLREEQRELNVGVGIGFEMYFGAWPAEQIR
jgi:hypothetical protein